MRFLLFVAVGLSWSTVAFAQPANLQQATSGYIYFNRPGADMLTHDSELRNCIETWNGGVGPPVPYEQRAQTGVVSNIVLDLMNANFDRARRSVNVEHCMVVRGWRVMRLDQLEGMRLSRLDRGALAAELEPFIGSASPPGEVAREWRNEAAAPDTIIVMSPRNARRVVLSELAMNVEAGPPAQPVEVDEGAWAHWKRVEDRPVDLTQLTAVPSDMAMIVVGISTRNPVHGNAFLFLDRESDVRTQWETVQLDSRVARRSGDTRFGMRAFVVHPGRWRVYGFGVLFDYCLGAPSFTVQAGQVVYLGDFDLSSRLHPNLDLGPARDFFAESPNLGSSVVAATWTNGATWPCRMMSPYALEFEGMPFEPGYNWGSAARPGVN